MEIFSLISLVFAIRAMQMRYHGSVGGFEYEAAVVCDDDYV